MKTDELYQPLFFTTTILKWKYLIVNDEFKNIIVDSLRFLKNEGSILVYAGLLVTTPTRARGFSFVGSVCLQKLFLFMRKQVVLNTKLHVLITKLYVFITKLHVFITKLHVFITRLHVFITKLHVFITKLYVFITKLHVFITKPHTLLILKPNQVFLVSKDG